MADPIHAWVDPGELRRIGELLMEAPPEERRPEVVDESAYGEVFEGYDRPISLSNEPAPAKIEQASHRLAEARRIAEQGGLLAGTSRVPKKEAIREDPLRSAGHSEGPFRARMESFGHWLRSEVGVREFFLTERNGEILVDEPGEAKLIEVAQTLAQASYLANEQAGAPVVGSLRVKLARGRHLEILPVETHYGFLILGLILEGGLPPATTEIVVQGLVGAVTPPIFP